MPNPYLESTENESSNAFMILYLLTGFIVTTVVLAQLAHSRNRLNFDSRTARILSGAIRFVITILHSSNEDLMLATGEKLPDGPKLLAMGPHRLGWEAAVVAAKMTGVPPRVLATDAFNGVPGVAALLKMFKTITVAANPIKGKNGESGNASVIVEAGKVLQENGCVAMFPQGNFAKIGQEPPRIYAGIAKIAIANNIPIIVIRLDGYKSLENWFIPLAVRNSNAFRAIFSMFHVNNIRAKVCCEINFHIENKHLSEEEKIKEISAQLYAYYRHTIELTPKQTDAIKNEIAEKRHLLIWNKRIERDDLSKRLTESKKESADLEQQTFVAMSNL